MKWYMKLLRSRDHIFAVASLSGYGLYSFFDPTPSLAALPHWISWPSYASFILAGVCLFAGYAFSSFEIYITGHILAITNLLTVALVVWFTNQSAVAILVFGFAVALAAGVQKALLDRKAMRLISQPPQILVDE